MTTQTESAFDSRVGVLQQRVAEIANALLPNPTASQVEHVQAFVLLTHAEFEAALEDLVRICADEGLRSWARDRTRSRVVGALVASRDVKDESIFNRWPGTLNAVMESFAPDPADPIVKDSVDRALQSFHGRVAMNNGIREGYVVALTRSVGVPDTDLGATWLADIDSLGADRNKAAHRSGPSVPLKTAREELDRANRILDGFIALGVTLAKASA